MSPLGRSLASWSKSSDLRLVHRGQLGVDGVDVRLAQGVAGQVDLPQRVRAPDADGLPPSIITVPPGSRFWA